MLLRALTVGRLGTNCYLVAEGTGHGAIVIDPGGDAPLILETLRELDLRPSQIVLTHFHFDHVLAVPELRAATGATLAIHRADAPLLEDPPALFRFFTPQVPTGLKADVLLEDGQLLAVGGLTLQVLHTPGHSPGGISLWLANEGVVFSGDALFREGVGRTDFPGCSADALLHSIRERLLTLPDDTRVYPGHGPATTIAHERAHNPWIED